MQIDNMYEPAASFLFRAQIYKEDQGQATVFFVPQVVCAASAPGNEP